MKAAPGIQVTVATELAASENAWAWTAYLGDLLLVRSRPTFASEAAAAEAGRLAAINIRRRLKS